MSLLKSLFLRLFFFGFSIIYLYQELVSLNQTIMEKNTSVLLGDYFEDFVSKEVSSGKYSSASEVIRTALRLLESEEQKVKELRKVLVVGEKSGFVKNFNRKEHLKKIHDKFL